MTFQLVKKNIRGNFKHYFIYFISLICGIVVSYTFAHLQYLPDLGSGETKNLIFKEMSILLILFVALFIWYSNSFFIKRRKKEIGLYILLGMRKKTVGKMLFYENLLLGVFALFIGITLGIILSKGFGRILFQLIGSGADINFNISPKAILNTIIVFSAILIITSLQGYVSIYRAQLIQLFQAEKKGEHSPNASLVVAGIAVVLFAISYWFGLLPLSASEEELRNSANAMMNIGVFLVCLIIGTYLLFRYVVVYLLKLFQKSSNYYNGANLIAASHLLYRMKGNVLTLTVIALLSATTLSFFSVSYSQLYGLEEVAHQTAPFSYMHIAKNKKLDEEIYQLIAKDKKHPILNKLDMPVIKVNADLSDIQIAIPNDLKKNNIPFKIISVSSFNQANKISKKQMLQLSDREAVAIRPKYTDHLPKDYIGFSANLKLPNQKYQVTYKNMTTDKVLNWTYPDIGMIVSDKTFHDLEKHVKPLIYKAYQVKDQQNAKATSQQFLKLIPENEQMPTYYSTYSESREANGLSMFVFGFLGLVFLTAMGSIVYFKQLSEAHEDMDRYVTLRKIGLGKKDIRNLIAKQTLFVFALPMLIGISHSLVIIVAFSAMLGSLTGFNLAIPIIYSMVVYFIIYLGFYLLTVKTYNNLVNN